MVRLDPDEQNGLEKSSAADAFQVRLLSQTHFVRWLGSVSTAQLRAVSVALTVVLHLSEGECLETSLYLCQHCLPRSFHLLLRVLQRAAVVDYHVGHSDFFALCWLCGDPLPCVGFGHAALGN